MAEGPVRRWIKIYKEILGVHGRETGYQVANPASATHAVWVTLTSFGALEECMFRRDPERAMRSLTGLMYGIYLMASMRIIEPGEKVTLLEILRRMEEARKAGDWDTVFDLALGEMYPKLTKILDRIIRPC